MQARRTRRVHLVGLGGSGLSSLAAYLVERGDRVSGCDGKLTPVLQRLKERGVEIHPQCGTLPEQVDEVVHSAAVGPQHSQLVEARARGVPAMKYSEFLGREVGVSGGVAVAGTHGKTTTTGLVAHILLQGGLDPSVVLGGFPRDWDLPGRYGEDPWFVVEACEYDRSFLQLSPRAAVVTNVEADHLDYFGDEAGVVAAFQQFLNRVSRSGPLVLHESAAARLDLSAYPGRPVIMGCGKGVTDRLVPEHNLEGTARGVLEIPEVGPVRLVPSLPGRHNLENAALAASLAVRLGVAPEAVEEAVATFPGIQRRLELLGEQSGRRFYSDYAHHPSAVHAVHQALRQQWPHSRLLVVFQPHQASRTRCFRDRFAAALSDWDEVVFPGIFSVREDGSQVAEEERLLLESLAGRGRRPHPVRDRQEILPTVHRLSQEGDVVVFMGAGDIDELAEGWRARARSAARA